MALTNLHALKTHLNIGPGTDDENKFLQQLLTGVETVFKETVDRDIEETTYTEYYSGRNSKILTLREYPVGSVASVYLDHAAYWGTVSGSFASGTLLTEGTDYAVMKDGRSGTYETGRLYKISGVWPGRFESRQGMLSTRLVPGAGNVKVTYTAGYAAGAIPADIPLCLFQVVAQLRASRERGWPMFSERYEDYYYTLMGQVTHLFAIGHAAQIVGRYKRITPRHEVMG